MSGSHHRWALELLLVIGLLQSSSLPAAAQPAAPSDHDLKRREQPGCGFTNESTPSGLIVVIPSQAKRSDSLNVQALNNAFISGADIQINWRDIEPVEGSPDWSRLDWLMATAASSKKWLKLSIFPGFFSPAWALEGARTDFFDIPYGPGHGTLTKLPMPWDRVYLDHWFAFVRMIGERYGREPAFRMISAAGPTSVSEEMTLPNGPKAIPKWLSDGYSPSRYLGAWEETFRVYDATFPSQCIALNAPGVPILARGRNHDRPAHVRAKQEVIERAERIFGRRLAIQSNDLHAGHAAVEAPDDSEVIKSYSGRLITGFEMRGGSQGPIPSEVMGAAGNPPLALRRSVDKGMSTNAAGRHVSYLEIYQGDVVADDMQSVLKYAASLFDPSRPR